MTLEEAQAYSKRKDAASRNKRFARKATESQLLDNLAKAARGVLELYGSNSRQDLAVAMRELRSATVLAEKRDR